MTKVLGIDTFSGYQKIDWIAAAAAGVRFAIVKCTEGNEPARNDTRFRENVDGARAAGVVVGGYHFSYGLDPSANPTRAGKAQAERYWAVSKGLGADAGDLPPSVDLEWPVRWERADAKDPKSQLIDVWAKWKTNADIIVDECLATLARIEELSGRVPIVYTYPDYMANLASAKNVGELAKYPLWIASYAKRHMAMWIPEDDYVPNIPKPWDAWAIHQFSADGSPMKVPGVPVSPVDRDCMHAEKLAELAGLDGTPSSWEEVSDRDFETIHPSTLPDEHPEHGGES